MKFLARLILIFLFIPVFIIFLFAVNLRFQLLTPSFWDKTLSSGDTFRALSASINKNLEKQAIDEGGRAGDVEILTNLITPENLEETFNKNINNFLRYANGRANDLIVYVPVNKIPLPLLSTGFDKIKTEMSLTELLKEFNVQGVSPSQIQMVSKLGPVSWIVFAGVTLFLALLLFLLYASVGSGKRLAAPGMALFISGLLALTAAGAGTVLRINMAKDLPVSPVMGDSIIGIVVPPIIQGVLTLWLYFAASAVILGLLLFFVKKPVKK
ncbi:hypothetical protein A2573_00140 [Candidatus Woesebacteria bacterium RIFOXYD1_FULL_43_18]|uniref:Uncharacterized protein n=1 Tax=Candidatus Woesebacteria bacterium RIFOXYD1_FULL_43_18 TaxID=1802551 RepID=A0A1F8DLP5_9BACT|nr:MAG: hypothetical protein A2573_00140 [Candidatus Woesebacteria bacterium RIFOXYD1_FULL_43_18]